MATGEAGGVSLSAPRPQAARADNQYVETPLHRVDNNNKKRAVGGGVPGSGGVLTRQPGKKPAAGVGGATAPGAPPPCSIVCPRCGKCRCEACRTPRRPPSVWLCSDLCLCSVDSCVDYGSCLCCVKGLVYHWGGEEEEWGWEEERLCSCSRPLALRRWACLALASLFLPCLCCYCPLRTCADGCEAAYAACSHRGCTCDL